MVVIELSKKRDFFGFVVIIFFRELVRFVVLEVLVTFFGVFGIYIYFNWWLLRFVVLVLGCFV